jgi:hypothetical protein
LDEQHGPALALDGAGNFVVAWTSDDPVTGSEEIPAQRFQGLRLLIDGFESGDTTRWSAVVP